MAFNFNFTKQYQVNSIQIVIFLLRKFIKIAVFILSQYNRLRRLNRLCSYSSL